MKQVARAKSQLWNLFTYALTLPLRQLLSLMFFTQRQKEKTTSLKPPTLLTTHMWARMKPSTFMLCGLGEMISSIQFTTYLKISLWIVKRQSSQKDQRTAVIQQLRNFQKRVRTFNTPTPMKQKLLLLSQWKELNILTTHSRLTLLSTICKNIHTQVSTM